MLTPLAHGVSGQAYSDGRMPLLAASYAMVQPVVKALTGSASDFPPSKHGRIGLLPAEYGRTFFQEGLHRFPVVFRAAGLVLGYVGQVQVLPEGLFS